MAPRGSFVGIILSIAVAFGLYIVLGIDGLGLTFNDRRHGPLLPTGHRGPDSVVLGAKHETPGIAGVQSQSPATFQRHQEQKSILLAQLQSSRPSVSSRKGARYRLLKALYGFRRYEEVNSQEVKRLETLYGKIPSTSRKVSRAFHVL